MTRSPARMRMHICSSSAAMLCLIPCARLVKSVKRSPWNSYPTMIGVQAAPAWLSTAAPSTQFGRNKARARDHQRRVVIEGHKAQIPWNLAVAFGGNSGSWSIYRQAYRPSRSFRDCTALNIWDRRKRRWVNLLLTSIQVAGLFLVIAAGFTHASLTEPLAAPSQPGIVTAAAIVFFVLSRVRGDR